jgi:hypothetical protein
MESYNYLKTNIMAKGNSIHEIIEIVRENERLKSGINDIVLNLAMKNGGERDTAALSDYVILYILIEIRRLRRLEKQ